MSTRKKPIGYRQKWGVICYIILCLCYQGNTCFNGDSTCMFCRNTYIANSTQFVPVKCIFFQCARVCTACEVKRSSGAP